MKTPSSGQCDKKAVIKQEGGETTFAVWHPQWGGYCGKALVTFSASADGDYPDETFPCFEVLNWHDGEFPIHNVDGPPDRKHYCDPQQLIDFALTIMEKQAKQMAKLPVNDLKKLQARVSKLMKKGGR